jgi:hypothetical protein
MGLDLCAFPRLSVLRIAPVRIIDLSSQSDAVGTLVSTISRAPHVRTVVVSLTKIGPEICDPLDLGLSSLPLHTVKFEVNPEAYDEAAGFFPRLRAKNMVRSHALLLLVCT